MEEILDRYRNGEMISPDSIHLQKDKSYKTSGGRVLYGGGGIMPDVFVPIDTSVYTRSVTRLYLDGRFNNFIYQYYITHLPQFQQFKSPTDFLANFRSTEDAWNGLVVYAMKDSINLRKVPEVDKRNLEQRIKAYIARLKWRTQGFYEVYNTYDPVVKKAREILK
jgi:carboxyl-terminal processing protease